MREKILIIKLAPYDSLISSNIRMLSLMKGLDELGYDMDLLSTPKSISLPDNDLSEYGFLDHVNIIFTSQSNLYEKAVSKAGKTSGRIKSMAKTIYHKLSLYDHTSGIAKSIRIDLLPQKKYKYIIAVSDPITTYIALEKLLSQGLSAEKIIEYWGDPLYGDITQKTIYPGFIIKNEERKHLSLADKIVYTSPLTLEMEKRLHPQLAKKMTCLPTPNANQKYYPPTVNEVFTVGYYGAYQSSVRNILPLYEAFELLKGTAKLNLVGDTDLILPSTENVMVKPRGVVKELEEKTDLFVCVLNRSGTQIPGKVYYMAASNRPVLVVLDGEMEQSIKEYLQTFNRFIMCKNDKNEIYKTILKIKEEKKVWLPCEKMEPDYIARQMLE